MYSNNGEKYDASKEESLSSTEYAKELEGPCELVELVVVLEIRTPT